MGKSANIPNRRRNEIQQIIDKANALDRRRQAQIANQAASIDRLLKLLNEGKAGTAAYSEEMQILHQAAAALVVERDELRTVLEDVLDNLATELYGQLDPRVPGKALSDAVRRAEGVLGR